MVGTKITAGFAKVDITPPLGVNMAGYFHKRIAKGVHDPLYASALAIDSDGRRIALISCDLLGLGEDRCESIKEIITRKIEIKKEDIMIHCTHTHTGPVCLEEERQKGEFSMGEPDDEYLDMLVRKISDAAVMASDQMKEVSVNIGFGEEDSISFIRRFRMKDGSVRTNPKNETEKILGPAGDIDPRVGVVSFKYADGSGEILLVNFSLHADITGGDRYSADYPGHMRKMIRHNIPGCDVVYVSGAAGDINHVDIFDQQRTMKSAGYSKKVGCILAAEVIKTHQRMFKVYPEANNGCYISSTLAEVFVPVRKVNSNDRSKAVEYLKVYHNDKDNAVNMDWTDLPAAYQTLKLSKLDGRMKILIQSLAIGDIVFVGLPGEIFTDIGKRIKEGSPYKYTFIISIANGSCGYFPTAKAFSEGGYETKNSPFTCELEDILVEKIQKELDDMKRETGEIR